jgi:superfamily I DNA/RNA helicase
LPHRAACQGNPKKIVSAVREPALAKTRRRGFLPATTMARFRLFDLNEPQHRAVTSTQGPLLILAGAGTGKTRVITARAAYLIAEGVSPENILAVTFTNKAATEMRERLAGMVESEKAKKVTMSTFHALCVRILRTGIDRLGYKNNFTIYDEGDQLGLIKKIITRTAAADEKLDPNQAKNLISKAKNNGWSAPADEETLLSAVFSRYQADLKTLNAVDFDDLLLLTVKLLSEHPEVREKWQHRFKYLMVDEFQDTNRLQLELVTLLADSNRNVAVVGDDDQSIYGWRGAEVANILEFEAHFPNPEVVKLEQNYRSTNAILGTANSLIKNNPRRRPKALWSASDGGEKVRLIQAANDREEAEFVTGEIQRMSFAEGLPWEAFAVLYRMNAQSRLLEENFRRLQIPYRLVGGKSFFDRREVKDVLAYFSVLVNPGDDSNLLRIINTPARGVSAGTIERATEWSARNKCGVWDALRSDDFLKELPARTVGKIAEFVSLIDTYETKLNEPLTDHHAVVKQLLEEVKYIEDMKRSCKGADEAMKREEAIMQILQDLANFQSRSVNGLQGFLDEVMLDRNREENQDVEAKKGVLLITLHAAKGLEFPHVFLVGLEEGILPHDRSRLEGTLDEERRLLYVGITRAMKTLTLTYCRDRMKYGTPSPCHPSSFIKELSDEWLERKNLTEMLNSPVPETAAKSGFARMRELLGG